MAPCIICPGAPINDKPIKAAPAPAKPAAQAARFDQVAYWLLLMGSWASSAFFFRKPAARSSTVPTAIKAMAAVASFWYGVTFLAFFVLKAGGGVERLKFSTVLAFGFEVIPSGADPPPPIVIMLASEPAAAAAAPRPPS